MQLHPEITMDTLASLSQPLETLLGCTTITREQLAPSIWGYAKSKNLKMEDGYLECNDELETLLGKKRVHVFAVLSVIIWTQ